MAVVNYSVPKAPKHHALFCLSHFFSSWKIFLILFTGTKSTGNNYGYVIREYIDESIPVVCAVISVMVVLTPSGNP